jgi:hypothetical protein
MCKKGCLRAAFFIAYFFSKSPLYYSLLGTALLLVGNELADGVKKPPLAIQSTLIPKSVSLPESAKISNYF